MDFPNSNFPHHCFLHYQIIGRLMAQMALIESSEQDALRIPDYGLWLLHVNERVHLSCNRMHQFHYVVQCWMRQLRLAMPVPYLSLHLMISLLAQMLRMMKDETRSYSASQGSAHRSHNSGSSNSYSGILL